MLKKFFYISLFIIMGCESKNDITTIYSRELIVFDYEELVRDNSVELTKIENDSLVRYKYKNLADSTKSMNFSYLKNQDKIYFGPEQFHLKEKIYLTEGLVFDKYETEPIPDGMGPLLFNKDYGVLAFDNGWGLQFHFLTENNKENFRLPIIYDYAEKIE